MNKFQKVIDDSCDLNIINIQLVSLYKEEQQVKRALELRGFYLIRFGIHKSAILG